VAVGSTEAHTHPRSGGPSTTARAPMLEPCSSGSRAVPSRPSGRSSIHTPRAELRMERRSCFPRRPALLRGSTFRFGWSRGDVITDCRWLARRSEGLAGPGRRSMASELATHSIRGAWWRGWARDGPCRLTSDSVPTCSNRPNGLLLVIDFGVGTLRRQQNRRKLPGVRVQ
jgi:hypothetical protein